MRRFALLAVAVSLPAIACDRRLPPRLTVLDDSLFTPAVPIEDEFGYPPLTTDKRRFLGLLRARDWAQLEGALAALHDSARENIRNEYLLREAFFAFSNADPELQPAMAEWLEASRRAPEAHIANAVYSLGVASFVRGGDDARDVPADTHARVVEHADRAVRHARRGLDLSADHLIGHVVVIRALQFRGWSGDAHAAISAGLAAWPLSHVLRYQALQSMETRWGGSDRLMRQFIAETDSLVALNPRLAPLRGGLDAYRGLQHRVGRRWGPSVAAYDRALAHGDDWSHLLGRGLAYYGADDLVRSLRDLRQAARQRPQHPRILTFKAAVELQLGPMMPMPARRVAVSRALSDVRLLLEVDPTNEAGRRTLEVAREVHRRCVLGQGECS